MQAATFDELQDAKEARVKKQTNKINTFLMTGEKPLVMFTLPLSLD
jgi:hypothetical protein